MPPDTMEQRKQRRELISTMLTALETPHKPLTNWEEGFVASLTEQFHARGTLSDRQLEVLDRIYTDKTP
jgi:hypothetical protein